MDYPPTPPTASARHSLTISAGPKFHSPNQTDQASNFLLTWLSGLKELSKNHQFLLLVFGIGSVLAYVNTITAKVINHILFAHKALLVFSQNYQHCNQIFITNCKMFG